MYSANYAIHGNPEPKEGGRHADNETNTTKLLRNWWVATHDPLIAYWRMTKKAWGWVRGGRKSCMTPARAWQERGARPATRLYGPRKAGFFLRERRRSLKASVCLIFRGVVRGKDAVSGAGSRIAVRHRLMAWVIRLVAWGQGWARTKCQRVDKIKINRAVDWVVKIWPQCVVSARDDLAWPVPQSGRRRAYRASDRIYHVCRGKKFR
ncbi:hypothetical protein EV126DRAFT_221164 [Verticillium dahliae]|nr:hypothetical protein EV126DRAFT_146416 [Verticillium dahliae]KAH6702160.1 hypothetical protein EV126DRAFT_221164 [Verticillium dahliae]